MLLFLPVLYVLLRSPEKPRTGLDSKVLPPPPPPAPIPAVPTPPVPPASLPAVPSAKPPDKDDLAEQAFDDLMKFQGLAENDTAGRMARIEEFLDKYGDAIVSSRARVLLQRLKKPTPAPAQTACPTANPAANPDVSRTFAQDFEDGKAPGFSDVFAKIADDPTHGAHGKVVSGNPNNDGMRARLCFGDYPFDSAICKSGALFVATQDFRLTFKYYISGGFNFRLTMNSEAESPAYHAKIELKKDQWTEVTLTRADFHLKDNNGAELPAGTKIGYVNWWVYPGNEVKAMYLDDIHVEGSAPLKPADAQALIDRAVTKLKELNPGWDGQKSTEINGNSVVMLVINSDKIARIDPIAELKGLLQLSVSCAYNSKGILADLTPLKGLPLEELSLNMQPQITDLSPLQGMPIKNLSLNGLNTSDISVLKGMPLETLSLTSSKVNDLSVLKGMKIEHLSLAGSLVKDLSPLAGMPLTSLSLGYLNVADLSPLKGMKLTNFVYGHPAATDFSVLEGMPLESLNLGNSNVEDIGFVKNMPLKSLQIARTKVKDLTPLKGMRIKTLNIGDTPVKDFSPIYNLPLESIALDLDLKRDAEWLKNIKTLKIINTKPAASVLAGN